MLILRNPLLLAFEAVCNLRTTHAAAKEIGVTQTAITQRIKALEGELNLTLFIRSRRGMELTSEGKALLQFCRRSKELEGQFISQIKGDSRQEVALTIMGPTSAISTRIAKNVESLYLKYPFLKLHLRSDDHADIVESIRKGEADFGIVPPDSVPNEMDSKMLKSDRYLLVATNKWKGRSLADILKSERIIDFYDSDRTTRKYLEKFGLAEAPQRDRLFINENEALIQMFVGGVGFGTLTEEVARPYLKSGKIISLNRGQVIEDPLALVWYPRPLKMDYFEEIVRSIK